MTPEEYRAHYRAIYLDARVLVAMLGFAGAARRTGLQAATIRRALKRPEYTRNPTVARLRKAAAVIRIARQEAEAGERARWGEVEAYEDPHRDHSPNLCGCCGRDMFLNEAPVASACARCGRGLAQDGCVVSLADYRRRRERQRRFNRLAARGPNNAA